MTANDLPLRGSVQLGTIITAANFTLTGTGSLVYASFVEGTSLNKNAGDPPWLGPNIFKDSDSPIGYTVVFCYDDPTVQSVTYLGGLILCDWIDLDERIVVKLPYTRRGRIVPI